MASILITPLITVLMAPGKFSILGMTATRQRVHYYNTMDKNTIKELCAVQSKSLAVTYIFQLTGQCGHPSALKTDSIAGQVLIEHKANKEVM